MHIQSWTRPAEPQDMQFSLHASSAGHLWSGFDADIYDLSAGVAARPPRPNHVLVMHLSAPVGGSAQCDGPVQHRIMTPGDVDFVPLGYAAAWEDYAPGRALNVRLSLALVQTCANACGADLATVDLSPMLHVKDPTLSHLGWALCDELEHGASDRLLAESIGDAIAAHLLRRYARAVPNTDEGLTKRQLRRLMDYIAEHLTANPSLGDLAAVAGVSPTRLKVLFKRTLGMPVHQYVIRRRIDVALELMSRGTARLSEVAQHAGFADQGHMARCMRRVVGMTPSEIAKQFR